MSLDLARLAKQQRQAVFDAFAPKKEMQLYDRGVRRRLATMLANDLQSRSLRCRLEELLENGGSTYLYLKQTGVCEVARPWTGELCCISRVCRGSVRGHDGNHSSSGTPGLSYYAG
jgi:hypothetical protein